VEPKPEPGGIGHAWGASVRHLYETTTPSSPTQSESDSWQVVLRASGHSTYAKYARHSGGRRKKLEGGHTPNFFCTNHST
jgi:hypothetical protein